MSFQITIDAMRPYALAHFWAAALPDYAVRPYDDEEVARLAELGVTPQTDTSVAIDAKGHPTVWFQQADTAASSRNRIHFDLAFGDRKREAKRLMQLGASIREEGDDHTVMLDPEGNQFCLFDPK